MADSNIHNSGLKIYAKRLLRHIFSILAVSLAFPAFLLTAYPEKFIEEEESSYTGQPPNRTLKLLTDSGNEMFRTSPGETGPSPEKTLRVLSIILGVIAIGLGLAALIRKENRFLSLTGINMGILALIWKYLIMAVIVMAVIAWLVASNK